MHATSRIARIGSLSRASRNARALPIACSVSSEKACSVIGTWGKRNASGGFGRRSALANSSPADSMAAGWTPFETSEIARAARTPTGMISMPVASRPAPLATSAVVPRPANGSSTGPSDSLRALSTKSAEKPSLYFSQRKPGCCLLPW